MVMKVLGTSQLPRQRHYPDMNDFLGTCVRVNDSVFTLLRRLNLVYFRWYVPSTFYLHLANVKLFQHDVYPDHSHALNSLPRT
jgi:hypothetical protein